MPDGKQGLTLCGELCQGRRGQRYSVAHLFPAPSRCHKSKINMPQAWTQACVGDTWALCKLGSLLPAALGSHCLQPPRGTAKFLHKVAKVASCLVVTAGPSHSVLSVGVMPSMAVAQATTWLQVGWGQHPRVVRSRGALHGKIMQLTKSELGESQR